MSDVKPTTISKLCSQLGFGNGPSRITVRSFKKSIEAFRIRFEKQGNSISGTTTKGNLKDAQNFATAFCLDRNRAERLWPTVEGPKERPSWAVDREAILKSVTHIFALQAYNKGQARIKAKRKTVPSVPQVAPQDSDWEWRELSPESMKFVGPSPPRGTQRRPVKSSDPIVDVAPSRGPTQEACLKEIENLNLADDKKPIRGFNAQWLAKNAYIWPQSAGLRMRYIMHLHYWYPLTLTDDTYNIVKMINPLRSGGPTEFWDTEGINVFEDRVRHQMVLITQELLANRLIEEDVEGTLKKNQLFKDVWKFRERHWVDMAKQKASLSIAALPVESVPDIFAVPEDDDCIVLEPTVPKSKKKVFTAIPYSPKPKVKGSVENPTKMQPNICPVIDKPPPNVPSPTRRSYDKHRHDDEDLQPSPKRQKKIVFDLGPAGVSSGDPTPRVSPMMTFEPAAGVPESPGVYEEAASNQQELESMLRDAEKILSSNIGEAEEPAASRECATDPRTPPAEAQPLRSASFEDTLAGSGSLHTRLKDVALDPRDSSSPRPEIAGSPTARLPSLSEPWSPKSPFQRSSSSSTSATPSTGQRLILVIQNSARKFDLRGENTLSSRHLRDASVFEFFDLYAQKSKASYEMLDCLTFTFLFGAIEEAVVYRGEVEKWKRLRDHAIMLFGLYRRRKPNVKEFKITVEIGDKSNEIEEEAEDNWGC